MNESNDAVNQNKRRVRPPGYHLTRNKAYRAEKKRKLDEIKATAGCAHCPETDPVCLDFHHIDPTTKKATISRLYAGTWGWPVIEAEIAKCIVLCANCHRKEHARREREATA